MKLIVENWNKFVKEGTFSRKMLDTEDFENFSRSHGLPPAGRIEADIIRNGKLDIAGQLGPVSMRNRLKIDEDFLVAWVTGRLAHLGGPTSTTAEKKYGKWLDVDLYSKYKDVPTKYDNASSQDKKPDFPADGHTPINPEVMDTHQGGPSSQTQPGSVSVEQALGALRKITTLDLANLSPSHAEDIKKIIKTCIHSMENQA